MTECAIKLEEIPMPNNKHQQLTDSLKSEIDHWLKKFPDDQRQSAIIAGLTAAQTENGGHLTNDIIEAVADYIGMPHIAAHEAATFYSMFELKPVGKHKLCVCTNISCMLCGSKQIVEHLEKKLGIKMGETTSDGQFTLKEVECLAACVNAPMMQIDDDYHEHLSPEKLDTIIDKLKQ